MSETPVSTGTPAYSAEQYRIAKQISDTLDYVKQQAAKVWADPKKRLPLEAEMILQVVNVLKVMPIPQLKLVLIILGIVLALIIIVDKFILS